MTAPKTESRRETLSLEWWGYVPIALMAFIGVALTGYTFQKVTDWERREVHTAFRSAANDRKLVIQREIEHTLGVIQDVGNFIDASQQVGRREFRRFVGPALKRLTGIQALEWVPLVRDTERSAFENEARRSFPRFQIIERDDTGQPTPAARRPMYFPVLYVQPYQPNKSLLGLDLASDPNTLDALINTAEAGQMQVSDRMPLERDGVMRWGFEVQLPIYHKPSTGEHDADEDAEGPIADARRPGTQTEPLDRLRGLAIGRFHSGDIVERALESLSPSGIDIRIYDASSSRGRQLLYTHASRLRGETTAEPTPPDVESLWEFTGRLDVANRHWAVVCTPVPGYYQPDLRGGWFVLVGGLAFTVLLTVYLASLVGRAEEVKRLVTERTAQLVAANEALHAEVNERWRTQRELQALTDTLEQRVALRTAEAESRAQELEQFAYVTSHDLKAPLRGISNLAGWIREDLEGVLTEDTREQLDLLQDRVGRMQALIEGLLEYSRVGRTGGANETVDTADLLVETIDSLAPPPGFAIDVAPHMPALHTDRLHLGQVFANLIGNAIKHHGGDEGHVWISARDLGEYYEFTVSDDGPGIPAKYHDKVFMMFQTLAAKDLGADTGIGLALVQKIVQEHGGSITLDSGKDKGATFRFTWPKSE
jgi:signal transduction histidine kinase